MRVSHAVIICRPPSVVWSWIADPASAARWKPEVAEYEVTTESPRVVGTEFRELLRDADGSMEMRGRVVEFEPRRLISFDLRGRGIHIISRYGLRARGPGTELDVDLDVSVLGPLTRLLAPFLRPRLMRQLSLELESLRILCESDVLEVPSPRDSTRHLRARHARRVPASATALFVAILVGACGGGTPVTPTASPSGVAEAFALEVLPEASVGRTIGGQGVVFLVTATGGNADEEVAISANAPGASISVEPRLLRPGTVGEVTVVPDPVAAESELVVTISASRGTTEREESRTLSLAPGEDTLGPEAARLLDRFTRWLATERPALGIGPDTVWEGTPGSWVLVVNHYQFVSDDWELGLAWHVMIAPDDWARIYLRHRWTEGRPSAAFEISSVSGDAPPHQIDPPDSVWR